MPISRKKQAYDAIIIGGGPAGAAAALLLGRAGWSVAVVEKAAFPRRKVCGEFISATSLPLLSELGAEKSFSELAGPPVKRIGLYAGDTILDAPMPKSSAVGWGRALGREHLDFMLLDLANRAGAHVWQPWRATSVIRSGNRWACTIESEDGVQKLSAQVLIAAAGSWERGPCCLLGHGNNHDGDLLSFKAHFRDFELADDLMPLLVFPGGYGGLVHTNGGRVSLSCCIRRDVLRKCRQGTQRRASDAVIQHIARSCGEIQRVIGKAQLDGAWLAAGPIRPGIRKAHVGEIFVTGNLAGEAHPIIAEGISMAMQSSWLLTQRLIAGADDLLIGRSSGPIGKAYAADWKATFVLRIRAAALFAFLAASPRATAVCRPLLRCMPQLMTLGARFSGKTRLLEEFQSEHFARKGAASVGVDQR
jgi:flavin-dependent dehydrogenase